jgi:hypothetical protein
MESSNPRPTATIFQPGSNGNLVRLNNSFHRIPRFLFRTTAPATPAITTPNIIQSPAVKNGSDASDILRRDHDTAASMLVEHLLWSNKRENNLISWSSSFVYAMQLALFRESKDHGVPKADEIRIWVIDTFRLPRGAFLPAVELLEAYSIPSAQESSRTGMQICYADYYHEFLSQGTMTIPQYQHPILQSTSLRTLRENGLSGLLDDTDRQTLRKRVTLFRRNFINETRRTSTQGEIGLAWSLSDICFPDSYIRPVFMVTLLSLTPRLPSDIGILDAMNISGWGKILE